MQARVRGWNAITFELEITNLDPEENIVNFKPGEIIEGEKSGARYSLKNFNSDQVGNVGYNQNDEIQDESEIIVDTSEYNQFINPNTDFFTPFDPENPYDE